MRAHAAYRVSLGVALLSLAAWTVPSGSSSAAATSPAASYSATGVCVSGVPDVDFSVRGLPSGQSNEVDIEEFLVGDDEAEGDFVVNGSSGNFLFQGIDSPPVVSLNVSLAYPFGPNAVELPATNLPPGPQFGGTVDYYSVTQPPCVTGASQSIVASSATPSAQGYWQTTAAGEVLGFGNAMYFGSMSGTHLNAPIVGIASTSSGKGYWLVASDGGVFSFGDAAFYGSTGSLRLNKPIVGITATPDGGGYYLVASDGGIFTFGDARFQGSTGAIHLNQPVVGMTVDQQTGGYWLVASDGGLFSFGAPFLGSTGNIHLNRPIVGIESANGAGYRFVASDGGVFSFGTSAFEGSLGANPPLEPIVGVISSLDDGGYTMVAVDGAVFPFGDSLNFGTSSRATQANP